MKKKAIKYLRKKGVLKKYDIDLNIGFKGGNIQSLIELLTEFAQQQANGAEKSESTCNLQNVIKNEVAICPICNVTELVNGNCKTCTDELCKPAGQIVL